MTLRIEVTVPTGEVQAGAGGHYLDRALSALGFHRTPDIGAQMTTAHEQLTADADMREVAEFAKTQVNERTATENTVENDYQPGDEVQVMHEEDATAEPVRLRGQSTGDRKRRTKEEMAEDKALEDAAEAAGIPIERVDKQVANGRARAFILDQLSAVTAEKSAAAGKSQSGITITGQTGVTAEESQLISTGEERVGPEDAQDRADEAAESAAKSDGSLTLDDLRKAAGDYQKAYGMAATVRDVPDILGCKVHEVADADLETAIGLLRTAIAENPNKRDRVGTPAAEEKTAEKPTEAPRTATKQDVIDAMIAYAKKYDGPEATPTDPATMPFTTADAPQVFAKLFGAEVNRLGLIPDTVENYGKAVAGLEEMLEKDPFKRGAKSDG
ncbi:MULTISPECIES: hypothetical protein [unclassified Aurantimonas]|uniref:hypothetical protein n=1 Tax=unclassified Aurantimonas TaxID=2638230 RepID=UPI002E1940AD|nr:MULTISPECIES: hypothetical protein [unclassified Aurantimonas]MEC5291550.1 hypothetical protein [Aurantimonas sp. C2-3-R2]MEC5412634.1 hypothetical protein [Aurantimonas sp. C2-4-R8]